MSKNLIFFLICLSFLPKSHAAAHLGCKLYNSELSAQLSSEVGTTENGTKETFLTFTKPVAWYPDLTSFQVVYASHSKNTDPALVVANAVSVTGSAQTVVIKLNPLTENVRYGMLEAGDFVGDLNSTLKKRKTYEIQCFY